MTDTTQAAAPAPANSINTFFASLAADWQIVEADVISLIQNIGAGVEIAAEDLSYSLSWLGSHIGQIATTVTAIQSTVAALNTGGVPIPSQLTNGLAQVNQAIAGVNAALSNQAVAANASTALTDGYNATKALQVAAANAAVIAASIQSTTSPAPLPVAQPTT